MRTLTPLSSFEAIEEQIQNLTDDQRCFIDVGNLGLPVGIDLDRVGVDLKRLNKLRRAIGAEILGISGFSGDGEETDVYGDINSDGSMTSAKAKTSKAQKPQSASGVVSPDLYSIVSTVAINKNAFTEFAPDIADKYSPRTQADFLNSQITQGLRQASYQRNLQTSGNYGSLDDAFDGLRALGLGFTALGYSNGLNWIDYFNTGLWTTVIGFDYMRKQFLGRALSLNAHHSVFNKLKVDRHAIASLQTRSGRFVDEIK